MITHDDALKIAQRFIDGHFRNTGREHPRISIPCDEKRDDDCLLLEYIGQCERVRNTLLAYQEWESDLVLNGDWTANDGLPKMTQAQYDRFMQIQGLRNEALK